MRWKCLASEINLMISKSFAVVFRVPLFVTKMVLHSMLFLANLEVVSLAGLTILSCLLFLLRSANKSELPIINDKHTLEFGIAKARQRYLKDAHNLITSGLAKVFFGVFR